MNSFVQGSKSERARFAIVQMQRYLRLLRSPLLAITGIFDAETALALTDFQSSVGLVPSGKTDLATWEALIKAGEEESRNLLDPLPIVLPPLKLFGGVLSSSDTGDAVSLLQILLNRFLLSQKDSLPLAVNGRFDTPTAEAVSLFRTLNGMSDTPVVDKATWDALTLSFSAPATFE